MVFGDVRVDLPGRRIWRAGSAVTVRPKAWALLVALLQRPGQVVTRDEIASAVWPDVVVGDDSITKAVGELRTALGDDARTPRYIETIHRVGLRFIAPVADRTDAAPAPITRHDEPSHPAPALEPAGLVGRTAELMLLHDRLERARAGARQVVFVGGEAGIGKSTFVHAFADALSAAGDPPRLLLCQCAERAALADPYVPVLDAVEAMRAEDAATVDRLLRSHAPSWHAQLPGAAPADGAETATASRILREGVLLLEALAADRPLVVVLEDAHAADHATTELIATLARRPGRSRLLVIVTFRCAEAIAAGHPVAALSAELELKRLASSIAMTPLDATAVRQLVEVRLGRMEQLDAVARMLLTRSGGNPLFLTALIDYLVGSGSVVENEQGTWSPAEPITSLAGVIPDRLRSLLDAVLTTLPEATIPMLEAAAVCGVEFDARAVAAALESDLVTVEDALDQLAMQERLLRFVGERRWNDGTRSAHYAFVHQLYEAALYARVPVSRRRRMHHRVAQRLEAGAGRDATRISCDLAAHFERGGDEARAVAYRLKSAARANLRGAHRDAIALLRGALALSDPSPTDPRETFRLLRLMMTLTGSIALVSGFVDAEVEALLDRMLPLCEQLGALPATFLVEFGRGNARLMKSRIEEALRTAPRLVELAEASGLPPLLGVALGFEGWVLFNAGSFEAAHDRFDRALEIDFDAAAFETLGAGGAVPDLRTFSLFGRACAAVVLGDDEAARADVDAGLARVAGQRSGDRVVALALAAYFDAILGQDERAAANAAQVRRLVDEHGAGPPWDLAADMVFAMSTQADADALQAALHAYESAGYRLSASGFRALAASRLVGGGQVDRARALMDERPYAEAPAIDPCWAAEQFRVRAELLARDGELKRAETLLRDALRIAREQKARLWEVRAATSLARLLLVTGRREEASAELVRADAGADVATLEEEALRRVT